ncbi:hypothetical protein AB0N05_37690 [Nocardia sp. NPDC051030]|uniref:hypothetical protein n=1 Tax=Nocardia sp. NPDC051030 TaxID=3155162 RepID=UPI003434AD0F
MASPQVGPMVPRPWSVPAIAAVAVCAGAAAKFGTSLFTVVCMVVAIPVTVAAWTDLRTKTLPLPLAAIAITGAVVGTVIAGVVDPGSSVRGLLAGVAAFLVLSLVGALTQVYAFGDVLLVTPLAILLGYQGWEFLGRAAVFVPVVALPAALIAIVRARSWKASAPLGPWLLVSAVIALATV